MTEAQTFIGSAILGANINQIDGDDLNGFHHLGANAGVRVVAVLNKRWRVGPELLFSQLGSKRNRNNSNISDYESFKLNTIELPLMVYYKDWRIMAEGGVSYQRLMNYNVTDAFGEEITSLVNFKDNLWSIKVGASFLFSPQWSMSVRWSKHLQDIQDNDEYLRARSISCRLIYTFGNGESMPAPINDK